MTFGLLDIYTSRARATVGGESRFLSNWITASRRQIHRRRRRRTRKRPRQGDWNTLGKGMGFGSVRSMMEDEGEELVVIVKGYVVHG